MNQLDQVRQMNRELYPVKQNFLDEMLQGFGSLQEAIQYCRGRLADSPIDFRLNLQVLLNASGDEEAAFQVSNELIQMAPQDPRVLFNRGWHLIARGKMNEGMGLLENGRPLQTYGHAPLPSIRKVWDRNLCEPGQTVIMNLEGGLGDEIINVRWARDLVEKYQQKVVIICQPQLATVFHRMPWVSAVCQREVATGIYHDWWVPGMSAAYALGVEYPDISGKPYLTPAPQKIKEWSRLLHSMNPQRKLKVGIRWAGNPKFEHQQLRRFPPDLLLNLRKIPNVQLFSFQRDNDTIELPEDIVDLQYFLKDWEDSAAALSEMDLVISSCTSVAHMSAALGQKTWVILPALSYYLWARPGDRTVWYDSTVLFRQKNYGDWDEVRQKIWSSVEEKASRWGIS